VQLGHHDALVPDPILLPALELVDTAGKHPMDSGMWVTAIPVFYSSLSIEITTVYAEFFERLLDPNHNLVKKPKNAFIHTKYKSEQI